MTRGVFDFDISRCGLNVGFSRVARRIPKRKSENTMYTRSRISVVTNVTRNLKLFFFGAVFVCAVVGSPQISLAQKSGGTESTPAFAPVMIDHMHKMRRYRDADHGGQHTPPVIDRFRIDGDPKGAIATFQPNGATFTANNAFFKDMGTNGRTCFTCHKPENGWGISAKDVADRFERNAGTDPIFRLVDRAACPSDDLSNLRAKRHAYKLLTDKGLIRIGLGIPVTAQFTVTVDEDHFGCNTNPATGIQSGIVSVYRRPLPTANVGFLSAIMWDG